MKNELFDKQEIAYEFIFHTGATFTDRFIGQCLAEIFMAIQQYEDYVFDEE